MSAKLFRLTTKEKEALKDAGNNKLTIHDFLGSPSPSDEKNELLEEYKAMETEAAEAARRQQQEAAEAARRQQQQEARVAAATTTRAAAEAAAAARRKQEAAEAERRQQEEARALANTKEKVEALAAAAAMETLPATPAGLKGKVLPSGIATEWKQAWDTSIVQLWKEIFKLREVTPEEWNKRQTLQTERLAKVENDIVMIKKKINIRTGGSRSKTKTRRKIKLRGKTKSRRKIKLRGKTKRYI